MSATGVVLLHGKWDAPPLGIEPLAAALNDAGHETCTSIYPWALQHRYDRPLDAAFDTIREEAHQLRDRGCDRIVLCGHSLGAAVALAFAARIEPVDGLIVLAPGHFPDRMAADGLTTAALHFARERRGHPDRIPVTDVFQGTARRLSVQPDCYLDYFDPEGRLVWPLNLCRLSADLPLFWGVGDEDPAAGLGIDYALSPKKPHPLDHHARLKADHLGTPAAAAGPVTAWLSRLESTR